jgi:phenylpyruvate tautomerase PptA (4-oxalocrotonate tautomerase family)
MLKRHEEEGVSKEQLVAEHFDLSADVLGDGASSTTVLVNRTINPFFN